MASLLSQKNLPKGRRTLIMGGPKTGKTVLMGQLARHFKLLWLDLEDGADSLFSTLSDEELSRIEYIKIPDTYTNPIGCETLVKMFVEANRKPGYICTDHGVWNCPVCAPKKAEFFNIDLNQLTPENGWIICIDSATQVALSILHRLCIKNGIKREDATKDDKVSFTLWDGQGATIDKLFSHLQNAPYHLCVTAHEKEVEFPDKSKRLVPSVGTRNYAAGFSKYFDNLIRISKRNKKHVIESTTASSISADTGGRRTLDLAKPGNEISDFFLPPSQVAHKLEKVEVSLGAKKVLKPAGLQGTPLPATEVATHSVELQKSPLGQSLLDKMRSGGK